MRSNEFMNVSMYLYEQCTHALLHGLLDALLLLVLAGPLAVELVREVAEGLLGAERAAVVVGVLQLDVGPEVALLAELLQRARVPAALAAPVLVVLAAGTVSCIVSGVQLWTVSRVADRGSDRYLIVSFIQNC